MKSTSPLVLPDHIGRGLDPDRATGWHLPLKIFSLLFFSFITALLQTIWPVILASLLALLGLWFNNVSGRGVWRRLLALSGFQLMLLVVLPFTIQTRAFDQIVEIAGLPFLSCNLRGGILALTIGLKAMVVALLMEIILSGSSFTMVIQALGQLRLPGKICQLLLLTHRYVFVLREEICRMYRAMVLRGFQPRADLTSFRAFGNMLGMLFVHSYERTERVYESMLLRGFTGVLPEYYSFEILPRDWFIAAIWLSMGGGLLLLDRL